jgi:hypothetical protein
LHTGLVYLRGTTDYGDSVEDEWLIVYVLRELTKSFTDLWVRVYDHDGEFLLIEAASVLPKWLDPENDQNRVWLHEGKLLLIPLGDQSLGVRQLLTLQDALSTIKSRPSSLVHSTFVEAEAFYRLEKYPAHIIHCLHFSMVTIPRKLAYILHERPRAIAPAVETFYLRDSIDLEPIYSSSGELHFPPVDLVTVSVRFSRVLFAQAYSQRLDPPPRWAGVIDGTRNEFGARSSNELRQRLFRLEMGMKLSCGFELITKETEKSENRVIRELGIILSDLEEDGIETLPSDEEISQWDDVARDDDQGWMDINFEDFERELDGNAHATGDKKAAFGDTTTQADLRKIVSRFEAFLNDTNAGLEGAEVDDTDPDDMSDLSSVSSAAGEDDEEDKEVSFDEKVFARMMREMMGMPPEEAAGDESRKSQDNEKSNEGSSEDEEKEIMKVMSQMEEELKQHGVLNLDHTPKTVTIDGKTRAIGRGQNSPGAHHTAEPTSQLISDLSDESDGIDEIDIDYNLAKNLLESFKSQGGVSGPVGNILSMMGIQLPRDEQDDQEDQEEKK